MSRIKINPEAFPQALVEIESHLSQLSEAKQAKALLICEEILTNQLRHADFANTLPEITLEIGLSKMQQLHLVFQDNSQPFNPLKYPEPDLDNSLEECTPGGLGIYLVKQYALSLSYCYRDNKNRLEVIL